MGRETAPGELLRAKNGHASGKFLSVGNLRLSFPWPVAKSAYPNRLLFSNGVGAFACISLSSTGQKALFRMRDCSTLCPWDLKLFDTENSLSLT